MLCQTFDAFVHFIDADVLHTYTHIQSYIHTYRYLFMVCQTFDAFVHFVDADVLLYDVHLFLLAHPPSKSGLHDLDYAPVSLIMQLISQVRFYYVYVYIYIYTCIYA